MPALQSGHCPIIAFTSTPCQFYSPQKIHLPRDQPKRQNPRIAFTIKGKCTKKGCGTGAFHTQFVNFVIQNIQIVLFFAKALDFHGLILYNI